MRYTAPAVVDHGSISRHTFTNTGTVPGQGPKGKDKNNPCGPDKFNEPSCGGDHGLS